MKTPTPRRRSTLPPFSSAPSLSLFLILISLRNSLELASPRFCLAVFESFELLSDTFGRKGRGSCRRQGGTVSARVSVVALLLPGVINMDPNWPNSFVNLLTGSAPTEGEPTNSSFQMHPNFVDLTTFPPYPTFPPHPIFQNMCTPSAAEIQHTQNFQTYAVVRPFYQISLTRVPSYQPSLQNQSNSSGASNFTPSFVQTPISTPMTIESTTEDVDTTEESKTPASHQSTESRNAFWSKVGDASLISAYVNISNDPIIGADQTKDGLWNSIEEHYKEYAPPNARARNKKQIYARWQRCIELKERKIKAREKKVEAMMRLREKLDDYNEMKIMSMDTSNMSPKVAHYWNEEKAAIIRKVKEEKQST